MANQDLDDVLAREKAFHDEKYAASDPMPAHYKLGPTNLVYEKMRDGLGDLTGQRVLEYGCGDGWVTRDLLARGANVDAFDISEVAVQNASKTLDKCGYAGRYRLRAIAAQDLDYADQTFDRIVGFAILHHLDLDSALLQVHRMLKPGGIATFAEPLAGNPLLGLYRKITPQYRTPDETPLKLKTVKSASKRFAQLTHREFYLFAMAGTALAYIPGGSKLFPSVNKALVRLDEGFMRLIPAAGNWAWYSILNFLK